MTPAQVAQGILEQELPAHADAADALQALQAAEKLLQHPRGTWPVSTDAWERLVVAVAVAIRRTEGGLGVPRAKATGVVRQALKEMGRGGGGLNLDAAPTPPGGLGG